MVENKNELVGGRVGKIHKVNETVVRPANVWTPERTWILEFLHSKGADFVPKPLGISENNEEILTFMPGEVYNYPLPDELLSDSMIVSVAQLLLRFHKVSEKYLSF